MADALRVTGLTKVYGDRTRALDAITLTIPEGAFFGLLVPNGAGKTTLIGAVSGLVRLRTDARAGRDPASAPARRAPAASLRRVADRLDGALAPAREPTPR